MKRVPFLLFLSLLIIACEGPQSFVSFTVNNGATTKIVVKVQELQTSDTTSYTIDPNFSQTIFERTRNSDESNWFYDYAININYIVNENSDTLTINPNLSQYWSLFVGDPYYDYALTVRDTMF